MGRDIHKLEVWSQKSCFCRKTAKNGKVQSVSHWTLNHFYCKRIQNLLSCDNVHVGDVKWREWCFWQFVDFPWHWYNNKEIWSYTRKTWSKQNKKEEKKDKCIWNNIILYFMHTYLQRDILLGISFSCDWFWGINLSLLIDGLKITKLKAWRMQNTLVSFHLSFIIYEILYLKYISFSGWTHLFCWLKVFAIFLFNINRVLKGKDCVTSVVNILESVYF